MTVRADHVTFCCLREQLSATLEGGSAGAEVERFRAWVAMVEVHLVAFEPPAAIRARNVPELSEELCRGCLAPGDALDLTLAIGRVVPDVRGALGGSWSHDLV